MRYLITGGAGFIGHHLCKRLLKHKNDVIVIDNLSTGKFDNISEFEKEYPKHFQFVCGDVMDKELVERFVRESDYVYHLASAVGVKVIMEQPINTISSIINGTEVVLEACCKYWKPVLITSTSQVYGKTDVFPFVEDGDTLMGCTNKKRWAYAFAKAIDEFLALAYYSEKKNPVVIVRLFNTTGERQTGQYGMVVPKFVKRALLNEPLIIHDDGLQQRCFTHVDDVIDALTKLIVTKECYGQVFNVGSNNEISILDLAKKVIEKIKSKSELKFISYEEAYGEGFEDMRRRVPSVQKLHKYIGYKAKRNIEDILNDVINDKIREIENEKNK